MTYNYGKQIRVCSKVSYILKENNDAGDLSPSLRIEKIIDSFTTSHGVEEHAHTFMWDNVCTSKRVSVPGPYIHRCVHRMGH